MMTSRNGKKLFLIDGHSLLYRAYYAIQNLSNSKGEPTNAIYGFMTMIQKMIRDNQPDYFAVCFDRPEQTHRSKKFEDYKAHRKPMPEDLIQQIEPIKEFCRAMKFPIYEMPGYEADDVLATLAVRGAKKGYEIFIVTGDKDAMQLVNDEIKIYNPHKELVIDREAVKKRWDGLGPEKVIEIMALMGDASDNIPGVPGIGEKTATKLIHQFGSVEGLIKNRDKISSKSQKALIEEHEKSLLLSHELVTVDTDVPVKEAWDEMKLEGPDEPRLVEFLKRYEFRNQLKEYASAAAPSQPEEKRDYRTVESKKDLADLLEELEKAGAFSVDTETTSVHPVSAKLVGLSFSIKPLQAWYIPVKSEHTQHGLPIKEVLAAVKPLLENPKLKKYGQNVKYDWMVLRCHGIEVRGIAFDTMIASYLINPIKLNHNLDDISMEYLNVRKIPTSDLIGSGAKQTSMADVPVEKITEYACEDADCVMRLVPVLRAKLEENKLMKLFENVEMPLALAIGAVELNGVKLDIDYLAKLSKECGEDLEKLTKEIHGLAGGEFNINSPKQLAEVLFERLKLPVVRKTKTGYSTDVSVLEKLAPAHDLPRKMLEYRERSKLKSTYLDALPEMIRPETGLVHTSYHQTTTATGRLSSSDPNLQNIPIRTEQGRLIRKAFIPRPDKGHKRLILSADYSQIELRVLAHLSGDPQLVKAFQEERDIHRFTATLLYGVKEAEVTREMRDLAKVINFSIIYGKTAYGLSQDLQISISEAEKFIQNYFKRYGQVKDYLDGELALARKQGYLTTLLGRRSFFPDIHSKNANIRQFAERSAINAPIQGSAADLIKLAMITIQKALEDQGLSSRMIMQVHDELVFDAREDEMTVLEPMVRRHMEESYSLRVPLRVDVRKGASWYKE